VSLEMSSVLSVGAAPSADDGVAVDAGEAWGSARTLVKVRATASAFNIVTDIFGERSGITGKFQDFKGR